VSGAVAVGAGAEERLVVGVGGSFDGDAGSGTLRKATSSAWEAGRPDRT
jgi:hypothetical protein